MSDTAFVAVMAAFIFASSAGMFYLGWYLGHRDAVREREVTDRLREFYVP